MISIAFLPWCYAGDGGLSAEIGPVQKDVKNSASYDFSYWDKFFQSKIPNDGAGGYAWVAMENGKIVAKGSGGYARAPWETESPGLPMTTTKPMLLASVSKLLTRVGLARLWELKQGTPQAFDYNQSAAPFLKALVPDMDPSFDAVTIRHLVDHTSGLTNDFWDLPGMKTVLSQPLTQTPGAGFRYLNANYYLLATIMTQIAGQPYSEFMRSKVFAPLGMNQTHDHAVDSAPTLIYGPASQRRPGALFQVTGTGNAGAGGWWSTAEDLSKLMHALRYSTLLAPATSDREGFNRGAWAWDGGWTWTWNATHGSLSTRVCRRSDTLDGILLINSDKGPAGALLDQAFELKYPEIVVEQPAGTVLVNGTSRKRFGSIVVGKSGNSMPFTIKNTGIGDLTGLSIAKIGLHAADFTLTLPAQESLAPGASITFAVAFNPTATGTRSATIRIMSNDADESPFDIQIAGTGSLPAPEIAVEQPTGSGLVDGVSHKSFGTVKVGKNGNARTFTIRNKGSMSLTGISITKGGACAKDFRVSAPVFVTLLPGKSTTFKVTFNPRSAGVRMAAIQIRSNDADENPFDIKLTGLGVK